MGGTSGGGGRGTGGGKKGGLALKLGGGGGGGQYGTFDSAVKGALSLSKSQGTAYVGLDRKTADYIVSSKKLKRGVTEGPVISFKNGKRVSRLP